MSYGVVRVQKFTAGSIKGIEIHDRREKEHSNSNPDIDFSRVEENYDLHGSQHENFRQGVNERIEQLALKKAVRKDAVVMAQVLVTSDSSFFEGRDPDATRHFFQKSYSFLCDRYGRDNVISATVHMDEKTPHMHFNFVPVTADGRLCAKDVLSKKTLTDQQTAFYEQVGKLYGLDRGESKETGKRRKHYETAEYKAISQVEQEATQRSEKAVIKANQAEQALQSLQEQKNALEDELRALKGDLSRYETMLKLNSIPYRAKSLGKYTVPDKETDTKVVVHAVPEKDFNMINCTLDDASKVIRDAKKGHDWHMAYVREKSKNVNQSGDIEHMKSIIKSNPTLEQLYQETEKKHNNKALQQRQQHNSHER